MILIQKVTSNNANKLYSFTAAHVVKIFGRCSFYFEQQSVQPLSKIRKRQTQKIIRRAIEFCKRVLEMLDHAMPDAAPQLMMRRGGLNQPLNEESPRLVMTPPDIFPRFVRFPKLAGIEQRNAMLEISEIGVTQLWRARGGVRGRRSQPVPVR